MTQFARASFDHIHRSNAALWALTRPQRRHIVSACFLLIPGHCGMPPCVARAGPFDFICCPLHCPRYMTSPLGPASRTPVLFGSLFVPLIRFIPCLALDTAHSVCVCVYCLSLGPAAHLCFLTLSLCLRSVSLRVWRLPLPTASVFACIAPQ